MARSFGFVEEKLCEAEFFLGQLRSSRRESLDARCYFSAFVSAARSVTWVLQASMNGVNGFETWYRIVQAKLKSDPLAPFFVEIRNLSEKTGENPLNRVTLAHLHEDLSNQLRGLNRSHVLVIPRAFDGATLLADAEQACTLYFTSLVEVTFECYEHFKCVVDPRWYFTRENFVRMGKTFEDAVLDFGLPPAWASCAPGGEGAWRALRSQQPACQINDLFRKYLGREIAGPDDVRGEK